MQCNSLNTKETEVKNQSKVFLLALTLLLQKQNIKQKGKNVEDNSVQTIKPVVPGSLLLRR